MPPLNILLGEDQVIVNRYLKGSTAACDQD